MRIPGSYLLPFLPLLFTACGSDTVVVGPPHTMPSEQRPTTWDASSKARLGVPDMGPASARPGQAPAQGGKKQWVGATPAGWQVLPPQPARFREALWRVTASEDTECYLTAGVGGGVATNMNRWYTQFGVAEVPALQALPVVELAGQPARLVELSGTFGQKADWAMLLAFYAEGEQVTSLKFTGPAAVVQGNREKFLELAKSIRSASPSPDPSAPPIESGQPMPKDHPAMPGGDPHAGTGAAAPAQGKSPFTATAPAGWTVKAGSTKPLHYTFGTDGEVYVTQLGAGVRKNLDIWRGEVQQTPMSDAEWDALPKVPMLGGEAYLLDASGDFQSMSGKQIAGARLLVAALEDGGGITFVKLVGPASEVATQKDAFTQFCASLRRAQ